MPTKTPRLEQVETAFGTHTRYVCNEETCSSFSDDEFDFKECVVCNGFWCKDHIRNCECGEPLCLECHERHLHDSQHNDSLYDAQDFRDIGGRGVEPR